MFVTVLERRLTHCLDSNDEGKGKGEEKKGREALNCIYQFLPPNLSNTGRI